MAVGSVSGTPPSVKFVVEANYGESVHDKSSNTGVAGNREGVVAEARTPSTAFVHLVVPVLCLLL